MSQIWNNLTKYRDSILLYWFSKTVDHLSCNISSKRRSVSSPDETLRRELKIRRAAEYFWRKFEVFHLVWWWNTVFNASYYYSTKMILKGEINEAKMSSFSSDFQTLVERVPATVKCCLEASPLTSTPPLPVIASTYLYIKKYLRL